MAISRALSLIRGQLDEHEAARRVAGLTGVPGADVVRTVYFPYHWYRVEGSAPALFGRRQLGVNCLVDACGGRAGTADRFAVCERRPPAGSVLEARQDAQTAEKQARRYVTHALCRGLRTLARFDLRLEHRGIVHKAFWVVQSERVHVLVDSTTGDLQPLSC